MSGLPDTVIRRYVCPMLQTRPVTPDTLQTSETEAERAEYEAWLDALVAEAPPIGPQTARRLATYFSPYLDPIDTPATDLDLPQAA